MTESRRIILNVFATYGRSLLALVCGLLTGRWTLLSLGEVDYGLYGVVGCMTMFIGFLNGVLVSGCARFYAISIGRARVAVDKEMALEECRRWFNTALTIETVFPFVLFAIGYPIGEWAICNFLTVPTNRVADCLVVFRFVCASSLVSMVCCPFCAMYTAKQYIAELTIYSVVGMVLNVAFGWYMISHPGDWLVSYSAWTCGLSIAPTLIIAVRATRIFPECRIRVAYMWDRSYLKQVLSFSGCILFGGFCTLLRQQGIPVTVNKFYGPHANAAMTVAMSVNGHASALSNSLMGAFTPAITTAYGTGDYAKANALALRGSKFAIVLSMLFTLPLCLEIHEVLRLWLKNPPSFAAGLCVCVVMLYLVDVCTTGQMIAVNAHGKIFWYSIILGASNIFIVPVACLFATFGFSLYWIVFVQIVFMGVNSLGRVLFARYHVGMSIRYWIAKVMGPMVVIAAVSGGIAYTPHFVMLPSLGRVCVTAIIAECTLAPLVWLLSFDDVERDIVRSKVKPILERIFK